MSKDDDRLSLRGCFIVAVQHSKIDLTLCEGLGALRAARRRKRMNFDRRIRSRDFAREGSEDPLTITAEGSGRDSEGVARREQPRIEQPGIGSRPGRDENDEGDQQRFAENASHGCWLAKAESQLPGVHASMFGRAV